MSFIFKNYQEKAINKLLDSTIESFIDSEESQTFIFKSPTGSGKTFMMTKFIERLVSETTKNICFIWISIGSGNLHEQSYNAVKNNLKGYPICSLLENEFFGSRKVINPNEIVFVNWEKLNSKDKKTKDWKNIVMREKETINFPEVLEKTRNSGLKIILIIDESHVSNTTERALELRDDIIKPHLTIEMSATPILQNHSRKIEVNPLDVIEEGMMKKEIYVNYGIEQDKMPDDDIDSQELVMRFAFNKRIELKKMFQDENSNVNPLVLIQIPNSESGEDKLELIEKFLGEKGITRSNGKLAVWLSGEEKNFNRDEIKISDNKIEFLVFKQAIATGWDCPRAHILIRFREIKSFIFETQTVGRILRMPEGKHYREHSLNIGYVYTNLKSIEVQKEVYNPNIIKSLVSRRKDKYDGLKLTSYYRSRGGFYNDVDSTFYKIFEKHFNKFFGFTEKDKYLYNSNVDKVKSMGLDVFDYRLTDTMLEQTRMKSENIDRDQILKASQVFVNYSDNDLHHTFESIIKDNLNGLAAARSLSPVKVAIAKCFSDYLDIDPKKENGMKIIQSIFVFYKETYSKILDLAIIEYKNSRENDYKNNFLEEINDNWEVENIKLFNSATNMYKESKKSIYEPLYIKSKQKDGIIVYENQLECKFIDYLEKASNVDWFWQNGAEHMKTNFGIKYNETSTFQPDFIVKFKNGYIGIFDTKPINFNVEDTASKSNALSNYIKEEKKKGKYLVGGIVVDKGNNFMINQNLNSNYKDYQDEPNNWQYFSELFK